MKKIRILHFIHSLYGGGAERQLGYLTRASDKSMFAHAICCVDNHDVDKLSENAKLYVIKRWGFRVRTHGEGLTLAKEWQPDIVHTWIPLVLPESLHLGKSVLKRRFLAGYRNVYRLNHLRRVQQLYCYLHAGKIVSNVDAEDLVEPFKCLYYVKSGVFIPNGYDLDAIDRAVPLNGIRNSDDSDKVTVLYVGRFAKHKNVNLIIDACQLLQRRSNTSVRIILCGSGEQEKNLRNLVAGSELQESVTFLGYSDNVYQLMKGCDCLILPSFHEGMPNVLFEAMLAKIPVIASDIPVHRRWSQDGKFARLFNPNSAESLEKVLRDVICESEDNQNHRNDAAYQFASQYSIASMVNKYEQLYLSIMES